MANFTVFVSSTFYDLRHVRGALGAFFASLGHEAVMFERGDVPRTSDTLDRDSVAAVGAADALVAIIGGRSGTKASLGEATITQMEIAEALRAKKLVWCFVERDVFAEYQTYIRNRGNEEIRYAYVTDPRVYSFLEELHQLPLLAPIAPFETAEDITEYLRSQFSGMLHKYVFDLQQRRAGIAAGRAVYSSAVDAADEIRRRLQDTLAMKQKVRVRWLGMSMFNAWNTLITVLDNVLPDSSATTFQLEIAMLHGSWPPFSTINETWARQADTVRAQIEAYGRTPAMTRPGYSVEVQTYAHMPAVHGCAINDRFVWLGLCSWEHGVMHAGTKWYEFFDAEDDPYAKSRASLFNGWFEECFGGKLRFVGDPSNNQGG